MGYPTADCQVPRHRRCRLLLLLLLLLRNSQLCGHTLDDGRGGGGGGREARVWHYRERDLVGGRTWYLVGVRVVDGAGGDEMLAGQQLDVGDGHRLHGALVGVVRVGVGVGAWHQLHVELLRRLLLRALPAAAGDLVDHLVVGAGAGRPGHETTTAPTAADHRGRGRHLGGRQDQLAPRRGGPALWKQ